jgi:hypothetical protein
MRPRSAVGAFVMLGLVVGRFGAVPAAQAAQSVQGTPPAAPKPAAAPARPKAAAPAARPPVPHAPGDVEVEPIACWWKTDRNAVNIGERFTLTLTCSIVETNAIKVVPDLNQLEPTTVALQPFEVVKGVRHEDIRTPQLRYLQYEYTTRLIGDVFFGKDVDIPGVKITYHIQSSIGGGSQGRDQTYVLPALAMRVNSLVPKKAADIRDNTPDTFAEIEARRLRSSAELVASAISFGFAGVLLALALVRVFGRYRVRTPSAVRQLSRAAVLRGCVRAAARIRQDVAREGWSADLAGRAMSVIRIASAVALGRPLAQEIVDAHVAPRDGQVALRKGLFRPRRALVSASTTSSAIATTLADSNGKRPGARTELVLTELQESLATLRAARYGRNGQLDTAALDAALERGTDAVKRLRVAHFWPVRTAGALARSAADVGSMVWSR